MIHVIKASKVYSNTAKRRNYHTKKGGYRLFGYDSDGNFKSIPCTFATYFFWHYLGRKAKLTKDEYGNKIVRY